MTQKLQSNSGCSDGGQQNEETRCFNPFPNNPWFLRVCSTSLENTVGKEEIARNE